MQVELVQRMGFISKVRYLTSSYFIADYGKPVFDTVFLYKYKSRKTKVNTQDELTKIYWITIEEIKKTKKLRLGSKNI